MYFIIIKVMGFINFFQKHRIYSYIIKYCKILTINF